MYKGIMFKYCPKCDGINKTHEHVMHSQHVQHKLA